MASTLKSGDLIETSSTVYELQSLLGSGIYGDVALCHNRTTNRTVALKILKGPCALRACFQELKILQVLSAHGAHHVHMVHWLGSFWSSGRFFHEFEKLDISLAQFLSQRPYKSLSLMEIRPIIWQMARALLFLQREGIMHTDLKPENIMMEEHVKKPLSIKIIDFGLACLVRKADLTKERQTLPYRAPESLLRAPVNGAIDMWSVGCIAAEMFLGVPLFQARDERDMMRLIVETVGHPHKSCLDQGLRTKMFYSHSQDRDKWTYKSGLLSTRRVTRLENIHKRDPRGPLASCTPTEKHDRAVFVNLLIRMLDLNPETRISPKEVLEHPFLTMSHLSGAYVMQSHWLLSKVSQSAQDPAPSSKAPPTMVASRGQTSGLKRKREEQASVSKKHRSSSPKTSRKTNTYQGHRAHLCHQDSQERTSGLKRKHEEQRFACKKLRSSSPKTRNNTSPKTSTQTNPKTSTHQGLRDQQWRQAQQRHQIPHGHQGHRAQQWRQAQQRHQVPYGHQGHRAQQWRQAQQRHQVPYGHQGHRAQQWRQAQQRHQIPHGHQGHRALQGPIISLYPQERELRRTGLT